MSYYQPYRQNPYYGAAGPMQQAVYPQYQQQPQQQQFPQMPTVAPQLATGAPGGWNASNRTILYRKYPSAK